MGKRDDIWFIRWGNLNPVKHKEARKVDDDSWIHIAPVYKGIYAFPRGYVEKFLITGSYTDHALRYLYVDGKKMPGRDFYTWSEEKSESVIKKEYLPYLKKLKIKTADITVISDKGGADCIAYYVRPKVFRHTGELWHHLGEFTDKKEIIASSHGWVKTSFKAYCDALHRSDINDRFMTYIDAHNKGGRHGNPHTKPSIYAEDLYEVFIEHVK